MPKSAVVTANLPVKNEDGTVQKDAEGKAIVKSAQVTTQFGETAEESIQMFGGDVVNSNFRANAIITLQGAIRRFLGQGKSQEEITTLLSGWKPGVSVDKSIDPVVAMKAKLAGMDADARKALLKELMAV